MKITIETFSWADFYTNLTQTVPIYAYNVGWGLKQLGRSCAVTVVPLIFLLIVCMLYFKLLNNGKRRARDGTQTDTEAGLVRRRRQLRLPHGAGRHRGFPLVRILLSSVKGKGEMTGDPTAFFPKTLTLDNYRTVIGQLGFGGNIANSVAVAFSTTLVAIIVSALGAYGVVRFFPKFGKIMTRVLITTYIPPILLAVPYAIWLLVGFFQTVPLEIEEAARVDGAIQYGHPGKKPPLWLHGIMKNEMKFFNEIMHGRADPPCLSFPSAGLPGGRAGNKNPLTFFCTL